MSQLNFNELICIGNQPIETKISNYPNWISSQIIKIDNELVHIEFNEEYLKMLLTIGDTFIIRFQTEEAEYVLKGFVENIVVTNPPKIIIKIENIIQHENDRKSLRYNMNFLCRVLPEDEEFKIQGITTNISESGISIVSYADFNTSSLVNVEVIIPHLNVLKFKGSIRRLESNVNNHIQYGIEITDIDNENKLILDKVISQAENNI